MFLLLLLLQPDFSKTPITSEEQMNTWLQFFEMSGPITCMGYVISADPVSKQRTTRHGGYYTDRNFVFIVMKKMLIVNVKFIRFPGT